MKFLDSTGLEYLWGKLKTALGGKGDSLDLTGQALSLKAGESVLSSVTLPGGGAGEVYSTEETVIGTWIDGKPIYRKAILATVPSESTYQFSTIIEKNNISPDLELGFNAWGIYKGLSVTTRFPTPEVSGNNTYVAIQYDTNSKNIDIKCKMDSMIGKDVWIIAEYTKTTDQPES